MQFELGYISRIYGYCR